MEIGDCVYILTGQVVNEYKIGKTNNIFHRLGTFRTASPEIRVRYLCYTSNKDFVEKNMHELYKRFIINQNHEWFKIENIEPVIKKLENIAKDFLSENQEITYNEGIQKYWYRELKFVVKSEIEKNIIIGKYDFKTEKIVPLNRDDLLLCFRFNMTYEEKDDSVPEPEEEILPEFNNLSFKSTKKFKDIKSPSKSKSEPIIKAYCKRILTKGQKKGEACGRLVTTKPINLCPSHANLKNICRFIYSHGKKKDMMCAIKIKEGEYCTPHQYAIRKREKNKDNVGKINDEETKKKKDDEDKDFLKRIDQLSLPNEDETTKEKDNDFFKRIDHLSLPSLPLPNFVLPNEDETKKEKDNEDNDFFKRIERFTLPSFVSKEDDEDDYEDDEDDDEDDEDYEEESDEEEEIDSTETVKNFKSIQENLMFLYKDLINHGFIRPCSRCKTFYTKNYFVKKGRVCHFCKTEWY
jgi:hypothetical protein